MENDNMGLVLLSIPARTPPSPQPKRSLMKRSDNREWTLGPGSQSLPAYF